MYQFDFGWRAKRREKISKRKKGEGERRKKGREERDYRPHWRYDNLAALSTIDNNPC